jgi:hypothetical protein
VSSPALLFAGVAWTQVVSSRSRPSFPPVVVLPGFAFPAVGPLGLGSPPSQSAPRRLSVLCSTKTASQPFSQHSICHFALRYLAYPFLCFVGPVSLGSLRGEGVSTQRQVSFLRQTFVPVTAQGDNWLSQVPVLPAGCMPCSRTPVVLATLAPRAPLAAAFPQR